jgi:CheY-like chemotaxis protein
MEQHPVEKVKGDKAPRPARANYKILLVEDNPHVMELYEYVMKKLSRSDKVSIDVSLAEDGFDALERLSKEKYDLVVTDLYMPVLDGFEFIRKLRSDERNRKIPVVVISAGGSEAQQTAKQAGADVYLRKPVRFVDVLETVKSLLKLT